MALVNGGEAERLATINIYPLKLIELQKKQDVKCEQLLVHIKITLVSFRMHLTTIKLSMTAVGVCCVTQPQNRPVKGVTL